MWGRIYEPIQGGGQHREDPESREVPNSDTVTPIEHYTCSLIGFVVMLVTGVAVYPALAGAAESLQMLSSTAIAFALLLLWLVAWLSIEVAWEWRAGRVSFGGGE